MTRFDETVFRATHNSYEHGRGSIVEQLDSGVRFLEVDVHSLDFSQRGYRIGHWFPGDDVANGGGNPSGDDLRSWLGVIADWSRAHSHAPITVTLDAKSDLTGPESFADGNLGALNALLEEVFGDLLLPARELGDRAWPALEELRGRVLCVLSGDRGGRLGYLRDGGRDPAVAANAAGLVVETHMSSTGGLWYWTGRYEDGVVSWARHGRYANGGAPSVAVSDAGRVVSVHGSPGFGARCSVGRIDAESLEIDWSQARDAALPAVASNPRASVRFVDESTVRVTYETSHGRMAHTGSVEEHEIAWADNDSAVPATAADARFHRTHAVREGIEVSVVAVHDGGDGTRLVYGTPVVESEPIRYEQVIFVEGKAADAPFVHDLEPVAPPHGPRFFAAGAGGDEEGAWGALLRTEGKLVRLWGFDQAASKRDFVPSFPACDHPAADWYTSYCDAHGAVEPPA